VEEMIISGGDTRTPHASAGLEAFEAGKTRMGVWRNWICIFGGSISVTCLSGKGVGFKTWASKEEETNIPLVRDRRKGFKQEH